MWRTRLLVTVLFVSVTELGVVVCLLLTRLFGTQRRHSLLYIYGVVVAALMVLMIYGLTTGDSTIVTRRLLVAEKNVPRAFDDYRIAVVSDLHVGTHFGDTAHLSAMVAAVNATKPDLICIVGDVVNFSEKEIEAVRPIFSRLVASDGVISVMGNHDYLGYGLYPDSTERLSHIARLQAIEREMGWDLLLNEKRIIRRGADSIVIVGTENDGEPPMPQLANLARAMEGTERGALRILLTHDPTFWRRAVVGKTDIPLTFAGHTHGFQFGLPGGFSPAQWCYNEWGGLYREGQQRLYVTTGLGDNLIPWRLGMPAEVLVCSLRHVE